MGIISKILGQDKANFEKVVENAPNQIGVYIAKLSGKVVYVGRAIEDRPDQSTKGLRKRLQEHFRGSNTGKKEMFEHSDKLNITIKPCKNVDEAKKLEAELIRKYNTVKDGWNDRYEDEKSSSKKTLVIFSILSILLLLGIAYYFVGTKTQQEHKPQAVTHNYGRLIDSWNKQVQNITDEKKFLLNRDKNDNMIKQLNEFMKSFYIPDISDSVEYNDFLKEHKTGKRVSFNTSMDSDQIRKKLKKVTGETAMSDIVQKVLMMNSFEIWSKEQKHRKHSLVTMTTLFSQNLH